MVCLGGLLVSFTISPNASFEDLLSQLYPQGGKPVTQQVQTNHQSPIIMNHDYDKAWREIDSLEQQGLPKTALEKTEVLLGIARKENEHAQVVKALMYRGKYQSQLEEEGLAKAINRLKEEAEKRITP
ncbi:MAG: hypothetical protein IPM82_01125 [Saprospiraceae bacterium]|nr:hypothetical protein [Saprospiraceae bacterium]